MKHIYYLLVIFALLSNSISAQKKCISHDLQLKRLKEQPELLKRQQQLEAYTQTFKLPHTKGAKQILTIPVVIHVIHNGEAIGTGANISDEQIYSQLIALNEDFRLLNFDSLKQEHPFWEHTADTEIEFCLAQQDPSGKATSGIIRKNGTRAFWEVADFDEIVKPATIWNSRNYLNIWTLKIGGEDEGTLGYAEFPSTATDRTDGVVVGYNYFGTGQNVEPKNNLGRTLTHEVGHYFNLNHIWGDEACGTDNVEDTEPAFDANYDCQTFPFNPNSNCGSGEFGEMYMNYMDYSDDACLVMFTFGQKERMQAALTGPRNGLLSSKACEKPNSILAFNNNDFKVSLSPNPSSSTLNIITTINANIEKISIWNNLGQVQSNWKSIYSNSKSHSLDISELANGTYILRVESNGLNAIERFTVIK